MELVLEVGLRVVGEVLVAGAVALAVDASRNLSSSNSTCTSTPSSLTSDTIRLPRREDSSSSSPSLYQHTPRVLKSGYFVKEGHYWKTWKKRWFSLRGSTITYHESNAEGSAPLGKIEVKGAHVHVATRSTDSTYKERECLVIEDTQNAKTFYIFPWAKYKRTAKTAIQEWLAVLEKQGALVVQAPPPEGLNLQDEVKRHMMEEEADHHQQKERLVEVEPVPAVVFNDDYKTEAASRKSDDESEQKHHA